MFQKFFRKRGGSIVRRYEGGAVSVNFGFLKQKTALIMRRIQYAGISNLWLK